MKSIYLIVIAAVFLALTTIESSAQEGLVSEYYFYGPVSPQPTEPLAYDGDLQYQWSEIIILSDNFNMYQYGTRIDSANDLRGWSNFGLSYQIRYLRPGTILVLWMGTIDNGIEEDLDSDDGYLEMDGFRENEYAHAGDNTMGNNNCTYSLINPSRQPVHSLVHSNNVNLYAYFNTVAPNVAYCGQAINNKTSVAVVPGDNKAAYISAHTPTAKSVTGNDITKGLPNQAPGLRDRNQLFWRELRQPKWEDPLLGVEVVGSIATLTWIDNESTPRKKQCDDAWVADGLTGYLVCKYINHENVTKKNPHPVDGEYYDSAENLRPTDSPPEGMEILGHIHASTIGTIVDDDFPELECGDEVIYRVYAYRYEPDHQGKDNKPENGRGRSYNETKDHYAEYIIKKARPSKPTIRTDDDVNILCAGDSIEIKSVVFGEAPHVYEWYLDGELLDDETGETIFAKISGEYQLKYADIYECPINSDPFVLTVLPAADVTLYTDNHIITSDTTIYFCGTGSIEIVTLNVDNELELDGNQVGKELSKYTLDQAGTYELIGFSSGDCPDTSFTVELFFRDIDYALNPTSIDFGTLDSDTPFAELQVDLTNNSNIDLTFDTAELGINGDFSIQSPAVPFTVLIGATEPLTIRYTPTKSGNGDGTIDFTNLCSASEVLDIKADKDQANLLADRFDVPFESLLVCSPDTEIREETVVLSNDGGQEITVNLPTITAPFSIKNSGDFPLTISSKGNESVIFVFDTRTKGHYEEDIVFNYESGTSNTDLAPIKLSGDVFGTGFAIIPKTIDFGMLTGCEDSKDSSFTITNTGDVEIEILAPTLAYAEFPDLPKTIAVGATETVQITFKPQSTGLILANITLTESVCGLTHDLKISCIKNSMSITYTPDAIDFGTVYLCGSNVTGEASVTLNLEGADEFTVKAIEAFQTSIMGTDIIVGDKLAEDGKITITFDATAIGDYNDVLKVTYDPCDIVKELPIHVNVVRSSFAVDVTTVNFGTTDVGTPVNGQFEFTNENADDIIITNITGIQAPFELTSHQASDFPLTVVPGTPAVFIFEFNPTVGQPFSRPIQVVIESPCADSQEIFLVGEGLAEQNINVRGLLPQQLMGSVNEIKQVQIEFEQIDQADELDQTGLDSVKIELSYNQTMLYPREVTIGSGLENGFDKIDMDISELGKVKINITIADDSNVNFGEFAKLDLLVLLGNALSTNIILESAEFFSERSITLTEEVNTVFGLDEVCDPDNKLVNEVNPPSVVVRGGNPFSGSTIVEFSIESDDAADLKIYSSNGELVKVLAEQQAGAGDYEYPVDASGMSSGVYYLSVRAGNYVKIVKLIVNK
jgi:type IX secretion system substrate protein